MKTHTVQYAEYTHDMRDAETVAERNADEAEGLEWAACGEAAEAAERGMTRAELRLEYSIQAKEVRRAQNYRALQLAPWADMVDPT